MRFLIHDRDSEFDASFDQVSVSEDVKIVWTSFRAPKANAIAERWVRSVRHKCLDQLLIPDHRHLARVLKDYVHYYDSLQKVLFWESCKCLIHKLL